VSLAYVFLLQIGHQTGAGCDSTRRAGERTFYHGTSGYAAELIVAAQMLDAEFLPFNTDSLADFGAGFYMSESVVTATDYAYIRGGNGRNGGPALVKIDISESRWDYLVGLGARDSSPVSKRPGQVQSFVPFYLIELFNLLKERFSFIPVPAIPGFQP
jgi:hypothetical protein